MSVYFYREGQTDEPELLIDQEKCYIKIDGSSYPEDVIEVYGDFLLDLAHLKVAPSDEFTCDFRFDILSSTSMRILHEIFTLFEDFLEMGKVVTINWYYDPDDEDMRDVGHTFSEILNLKFNIISLRKKHY